MSSLRTVNDERDMRNLRRVSKRVKKFGTLQLQLLQQTMLYEAIRFEHEHENQLCAGLAAPQVGVNLRVIMMRNSGDADQKSWTFMFNPIYEETLDSYQITTEGCLSIPDYEGRCVRPSKARFHYQNEFGEVVPSMEIQGAYTAVLCHELDHLNGVVFTDNEVKFTQEQAAMIEEQERVAS